MRALRLLVEYQANDYVKRLEADLKAAETLIDELRRKAKQDDIKYAGVMRVNIELMDVCKAHGIDVRTTADARNW